MSGFRPVETKQSFPELEQRMLERWREREVFKRSLDQREGAELWNFYEGPPTANGRPGSHHVLARVFKDIYPRYRSRRAGTVMGCRSRSRSKSSSESPPSRRSRSSASTSSTPAAVSRSSST